MELNATSGARGSQPAGRTASGGTRAAKQPQGSVTRLQRDRVSISSQVLHMLEEQNRQAMEQAQQKDRAGKDKLDVLEKSLRAGDKVPEEDLRYLMVKDPAGYRLAMATRKPKKNPEEHDSVLTDQDRQQLAEDPTPITTGPSQT